MDLSKEASLSDLRAAINQALAAFVQEENRYLRSIGAELNPVADALERFLLDSGKRLRPLFAYVGYLGTGATPTDSVIKAASALELIHVCALIHDDVMDGSDTRRGAPAIHKAFEQIHHEQNLEGSSVQFGISSAILLGDLALIWASKFLHQSGIDPQAMIRALPLYDEMRVELMAGQYLDVYEQALASASVERSLRVARFKSGKYTIERPLHFGAALGTNAASGYLTRYSEYGLPLGEAFQLRDDVLGVFGDPLETGKPAGDDLREGKRTVLMAMTHDRASTAERALIKRWLGNQEITPDAVNQLRDIIVTTGALAELERTIESLTTQALAAIHHPEIDPVAQKHLEELVTIAIKRSI